MMTYWYPGVVEAIGGSPDGVARVPVSLGGNYATPLPGTRPGLLRGDVVIAGDGSLRCCRSGDLFGDRVDFDFDGSDLDSYPYTQGPEHMMKSRGFLIRVGSYCARRLLNRGFRMRDPCGRRESNTENRTGVSGIFSFYDDAR